MKKLTLAVALLLAGAANAQTAGVYLKQGAIAELGQKKGRWLPFSLQSSVGQNTCGIEGQAEILNATHAAFSPSDPKDMCVVLLNFGGGGLKVTTKSCAAYCGVGADGSMDGAYLRKR